MITLQEITSKERLEEYFRFRKEIYINSKQAGGVSKDQISDKDSFDTHATHLGWYDRGELCGCVRLIHMKDQEFPSYAFSHSPDLVKKELGELLIETEKKHAEIVEVSRFCIRPDKRKFSTAKDFVISLMATAKLMGFNYGLMTCCNSHSPFWKRLGFTTLNNTNGWNSKLYDSVSHSLVYRYNKLPIQIKNEISIRILQLIEKERIAA